MKVLFSNPPWWVLLEPEPGQCCWRGGVRAGSRWPSLYGGMSQPDRFRFGDYLPYPFFMGYAASYVRAKTGADVYFRDSIALRESYERYWRYVSYECFDYVFIESATSSWAYDEAIIRELHRRCPETRIVLTGPNVAARATEFMETCPIHACIKGEYEKGAVRVLEGASGIIEFDLLSEEEMNAAPFPYYDDLHARRYWDPCPMGTLRSHAQIWSSRGCPYHCIFCVWPATMTGNDPDGSGLRRVRRYSPEYVEGFVTELVERFGFKSIYFDDDTFNLGDRHVLGICEVMRRIGIPWAAMCRADTVRLDTWRVMKESGCFGVKVGFESGSQWVLDNIIRKNLNLEAAAEAVREIHRIGMTVHGTFTLGLPGETQEQMAETLRFIGTLPLDTYQVSGTATVEGTPMYALHERGTLDRYPGAVGNIDELHEADGNIKFQRLVQSVCS